MSTNNDQDQPAAPTATPGITTERDVRNTVTPAPAQGEAPVSISQHIRAYLNSPACCNGEQCACMGVTKLQQMVQEEAGTQITTLRQSVARLTQERDEAREKLAIYAMAESAVNQNRLFGNFLGGGSSTPLFDTLKKMLDAAMHRQGEGL